MQTTSCTWPYVVPIGEDPAAHGHWCAFTDLYHATPCHAPWTQPLTATGAPSQTSAMPCHAPAWHVPLWSNDFLATRSL